MVRLLREELLEHPGIDWNFGAEDQLDSLSAEALLALQRFVNYSFYDHGQRVQVNKLDHRPSWGGRESHAVDVWIPGVSRERMKEWAKQSGFIGGADAFIEKGSRYMEFITKPYPSPRWRGEMFRFDDILDVPEDLLDPARELRKRLFPGMPDIDQETVLPGIVERFLPGVKNLGLRIIITIGGSSLIIIMFMAFVNYNPSKIVGVVQQAGKAANVIPFVREGSK